MEILTIGIAELVFLYFCIWLDFIKAALAICGITLIAVLIIVNVAQKKDKWIPCEKSLPPQPKENPDFEYKPLELYLVSDEGKYVYRAFWNGKFFADGFSKIHVDAWQPLPEAYKPKVKKRYKITGYLNAASLSWEDDVVQVKKTVYARFIWTRDIKTLYMQIFYDWVEVEEEVIGS